MNERIKEIREQAWTLVSSEERDRGELYETRERWGRCDQKFAELIAKQAIETLEFHGQDAAIPYLQWMFVNSLGINLNETRTGNQET